MADDIDDLLDEVESKYIKPSSSRQSRVSGAVRKPSKSQNERGDSSSVKAKRSTKSEVDELLDDLDINEMKLPTRSSTASIHCDKAETGQMRCFPVLVGTPGFPIGHGTSVTERACDRLRCTACDFRVSMFDNLSWHSSTDYLFLRNNMPDFDRLKSKLLSSRGNRAYACQCRHLNVKSLTDLSQLRDLKWVCGRH